MTPLPNTMTPMVSMEQQAQQQALADAFERIRLSGGQPQPLAEQRTPGEIPPAEIRRGEPPGTPIGQTPLERTPARAEQKRKPLKRKVEDIPLPEQKSKKLKKKKVNT